MLKALDSILGAGLRMVSDSGAGLAPDQLSALSKLSPANRRLVMELILKLLALQEASGQRYATHSTEAGDLDYASYVVPWIASLLTQGRSLGTLVSYRHKVEALLQEYPQPTTLQIERFLAARQSTTAPRSIANHVFPFRSFFAYLEERELIAVNPVRYLKAPRQPRRERQVPSTEHLQRLVSAPTTSLRDRALILLLLDCGLRISEALGLQLAELSLDDGEVTVIGKGDKQRSVPLSEETKEVIAEHLLTLAPDSTWLFPGRHGANHMTPNYADELFARLCKQAGVPKTTPHQLRHFFASVMIKDGANLPVVSRLLGHRDIKTTMTYVHIDEEMKRQEHAKHSPLKQILKAEDKG